MNATRKTIMNANLFSRLFDKLDAKRRTQAVQIAKDAGLIP